MRKYYLDNIRWCTVVLVMVYHVFYMFNASGVLGGVGSFSDVQYQDCILYFVYPWFMILLFLVAGISARYALMKLSAKEFIAKRTWKLLVPSTVGLFVFQWIVGYFNIKIGGGLDYIPTFMVYPISVLSGTGPMWFVQVLWLFSLALLLIRKIDSKDRLWKLCEKCSFIVILLFAALIWGGSFVLNMPVLTTYRFGIYFVAFLLGYFVFSHDKIQEKLEKAWLPMLIISVVMGAFYVIYYFGQNYTDAYVLESPFTNVYAWFMTLAILGVGKKWFNIRNKFSEYMTRCSYGLYILHYTFVLIPCYYLKNYLPLPAWAVYMLALLIVILCTPALYELIRRIPVLRCAVLGMRRKKNDKR